MNEACAFCGIVAGTTPAERVYEDDAVVAVMDINPATKGHVVVMSKNHSADLWEVPIGDAQRVMAASVRVARMIRDSLEPHGLNLVHASGSAAWQTVFHFHVHVVPRYRGDGLIPPWPLGGQASEAHVLRDVAERIRRGT